MLQIVHASSNPSRENNEVNHALKGKRYRLVLYSWVMHPHLNGARTFLITIHMIRRSNVLRISNLLVSSFRSRSPKFVVDYILLDIIFLTVA